MDNLCNISVVKSICGQFGFNFSKSLGQNFLINPTVCPKIAKLSGGDKECGVIEIGTGFGVLTTELAKSFKKVVAIEIDKALIPVLEHTLAGYDNITVINEDVLKVDLKKLIEDEFDGMDVYICANLPYYITSPIIMGILEQRLRVKSITVMVQKETAVRLSAQVGSKDCSSVTFAVRYYATPSILFDVSRGSFMPRPNVDSAVIKLTVNESTPKDVPDEQFLFKVVRLAFSQRRKTLANPVSAGLNLKKSVVIGCLESMGKDRNTRAQEMEFEEFIRFSNLLLPHLEGLQDKGER